MGERQADHKHQDLSAQRLCVEHLTLWQRNLDNLCPIRASPHQLSSICVACDASWVYSARTEYPTRMSSSGRTLQACSRCCSRDAYTGSAMFGAWRMVVFQRISSTVNLRQVPDRLAVQCYATRTCTGGT